MYTSLALVDLARHPVHHTIECEAVAREVLSSKNTKGFSDVVVTWIAVKSIDDDIPLHLMFWPADCHR